jgi:hypothetical protein
LASFDKFAGLLEELLPPCSPDVTDYEFDQRKAAVLALGELAVTVYSAAKCIRRIRYSMLEGNDD